MIYKHSNISDLIIKAFFTVYNKLGYGFLEKVYENAMMIELKKIGLSASNQVGIKVYYDEYEIGNYNADILVEDLVIVELKASECLSEDNEAQLTNYLRSTNIEVGLLMNFGKTAQFKRKIFDNEFKKTLTTINKKSI
jgi:GxxExxY protein